MALAVAEAEPILGLPDWPSDFPAASDAAAGDEGAADSAGGGEAGGFRLRRVESMCAAHAAAAGALAARLAMLKVGWRSGFGSAAPTFAHVRTLRIRYAWADALTFVTLFMIIK